MSKVKLLLKYYTICRAPRGLGKQNSHLICRKYFKTVHYRSVFLFFKSISQDISLWNISRCIFTKTRLDTFSKSFMSYKLNFLKACVMFSVAWRVYYSLEASLFVSVSVCVSLIMTSAENTSVWNYINPFFSDLYCSISNENEFLFLFFLSFINYTPHHKMWGGGLYWIRFVASVGRSVRLQFLSAL